MRIRLKTICLFLLITVFSLSVAVPSYAEEINNSVETETRQESLYGTWTEETYKRPQMQIYPGSYSPDDTEEHDLYIKVYWANTSMDGMEYLFSLDRTEEENVYRYENGVINGCVYDSGEGIVRRNYTEESKGTITITRTEDDEMEIKWVDSFDESCEKLHLIQIEKGIPGTDTEEDSDEDQEPFFRAFPLKKRAE